MGRQQSKAGIWILDNGKRAKRGRKDMNEKKQEMVFYGLGLVLALIGMVLGGLIYWNHMFHMPYRMEADCRGMGIRTETMKGWMERETYGFSDIINMAGWRIDKEQMVSSVSTGRKQKAQIISVYGSMELVEVTDILWGRYGLHVEGDYCVLSRDLANHLFGSVKVAGECIKIGRERFLVAGVIEKEGDSLMIPMKEGEIEALAVSFGSRVGAKEKMERLISQ